MNAFPSLNTSRLRRGLLRLNGAGLSILSSMLLLAGCATKGPGPTTARTIQIELDPALKGQSVLVDLVGVNEANAPRWKAYSMTKYWSDGDPMRADAAKWTANFISQPSLVKTLEVSDPIWKQWQGAAYVFVLADLPGKFTDQPGTQDARRQILPLFKSAWPSGTKELKVRVQQSGIQVVTPLRVQ